MGPLCVGLVLEIERLACIRDVRWSDKEGETGSEHECVYGEEEAVGGSIVPFRQA